MPDQAGSAYVTYISATDGKGYVAVINPDTKIVVDTIAVGQNPGAIARSPDGDRLYVANQHDNTVSVIDVSSVRVTATLPVGANPAAILVTSDNKQTYVANYDAKSVTVIDNAALQVMNTLTLQGKPFSLTVDPKSWFVLAACKGSSSELDSYAVIDTIKHTVRTEAILWHSREPQHNPIAITRNGDWVSVFGTDRIVVFKIGGPSSFGYHTTWHVGGGMAAVSTDAGRWQDFFCAIQGPPSTRMILAGISTGMDGPFYINSYEGQSDIAVSTDSQKICVIIKGENDTFSGLQIMEPFNSNTSHFVSLPAANRVVITADSLTAFVSEDQCVSPMDLINYTKAEAIPIGGRVNNLIASYTTQS